MPKRADTQAEATAKGVIFAVLGLLGVVLIGFVGYRVASAIGLLLG